MARALADIKRDILSPSEQECLQLLLKLIDDLETKGDANSGAAWHEGPDRIFPAEDVLKEYRNTLKQLGD